MLNFDRQFEIHDDVEVMRRMGMTYGLERGYCSVDDRNMVLSRLPTAVHRIVTGICSYLQNIG